MQTEAIFENIAEHILKEISTAQKSIYIAVAWFTNKRIFEELINKANLGCTISLIISNDSINQNSQIDYNRLNIHNSRVYKVGNGETDLMHNKFCIIDYNTVITGSHNWSYKAENNFENVIITSSDTALAEQFISEFKIIRKQYFPDEAIKEDAFPLEKIIKRLEILKNYIILEDIDELNKEVYKIKAYSFNSDLDEIINDISKQEFSSAINKIQYFISKNQQLLIWTDPEIAALKLEIKNLENQLNAFDNERIELEKMLSEFLHRHAIELGDILLEILKLRKLKFKANETKYEEAENDEKQYREQLNSEKEKEVYKLTEEEKEAIKKTFRKATMLCHPDKVGDQFKEAAQSIFIELKAAYDKNDYKKVNEIFEDLKKGNFFKYKSETVTEKDLLIVAIAKIRKQIKNLETEIISIKQSDTYKTINSIDNWDEYYDITKQKLQEELHKLKKELIS